MMLIMAWKSNKPDHRLTPPLFCGELSQITQDYGLNQLQLLDDCQGGGYQQTLSTPAQLNPKSVFLMIR